MQKSPPIPPKRRAPGPPCATLLALATLLLLSANGTQILAADNDSPVRSLQMSFDPEDAADSDFLQHLLMSHGLVLETGEQTIIGSDRYNRFIDAITNGQATSNPDIQDVSHKFSLSLLKGLSEPARHIKENETLPLEHRLLWWIDVAPVNIAAGKNTAYASSSGTVPTKKASIKKAPTRNTPSDTKIAATDNDSSASLASTNAAMDSAIRTPTPGTSSLPASSPAQGDAPDLTTAPSTSSTPSTTSTPSTPSTPSKPSTSSALSTPIATAIRRSQDPSPVPASGVMRPDRHAGELEDAQPEHPSGDRPSTSDRPVIRVNDDVPAGFEALSGPQFMFVDVFFNDAGVGSTGIVITDNSIEFDDPEEAAMLLAGVVSDPELAQWLNEPLAANGHLACFGNNDPQGCGQINADPIALIYNAVLLRLDVFVTPDSQRAGMREQARYLSNPEGEASGIVSLHGIASELSTGPARIDLTGTATVSYGRSHLYSDLHYNNENDHRSVNTLNLTHHFNDYELNAGTFGVNTGGALSELDIIGVGFSSSLKTRVDLEQAFSSQLPVYLPSRSVVQILIDDRIYTGASYAAGNQLLDTSALPDGTYEVEILINEGSGEQRRERRLFTKSTLIPPEGQWLLSATAGAIRDSRRQTLLPEASDVRAAGVNLARRLGNRSAYRLGVLQYDDASIAQGEFLYLGQRLSANFAVSIGEKNLRAASLQSTLRVHDHHLGFTATHFSSTAKPAEESVASDFFIPDNTRLDLSYHRVLPWASFGASVGIRRETDRVATTLQQTTDTRTLSLYAQRPVLRNRFSRGFLGFRYQQDDEQSFAQISLDIYFGQGAWRANTGATFLNRQGQGSHWQTNASAGWRSDTSTLGTLSADAYVTDAHRANTYGFSTEMKHPWFRANVSSDYSRYGNEASYRNSIASFSAHAGIDKQGVSMGGGELAESGLIIDVSGEPAGETFDVLVNNARVDEGRIGSTQFIGLQPFDSYEVKLRPHTVMTNGIGEKSHTLTLFPGNIGRLSLEARRQALLIAMVNDESGNTIDNAVVTTTSNTLLIDGSGILQAEVHQGEVLEVRKRDGSTCRITVNIEVMEDVIVPDNPLFCDSGLVSVR